MDSGVARRLYERYAAAAFYVAVRDRDGGAGIGTATHVGDGVFVTARHVLEGNSIDEVGCSESTHIRLPDGTSSREHVHDSTGVWPAHSIRPQRFHATTPPVFHPDPRVDLAAFTLPTLDPLTPWVPLGGHLEDWLGISDFVLWEVVLMGYPPIPLSTGPRLVAARAEVNGLVDLRDAAHVHFILSTMPRGGFSGAMAITEDGAGLGVVTRSLLNSGASAELGYMATTSIEPIYTLLVEASLLPKVQDEVWDGLWEQSDDKQGGSG